MYDIKIILLFTLQIVIEGLVGGNRGDIAIDNIKLYVKDCGK